MSIDAMVQIPAHNEEKTIKTVIEQCPSSTDLPVDTTTIVVLDDGSTDKTVSKAQRAGADRVLSTTNRKGLVQTFMRGVRHARKREYDLLVNMDADYEHDPKDLPGLIQALLNTTNDVIIGWRPNSKLHHYPVWKKVVKKTGSAGISLLTQNRIFDAVCGYRVMSKSALQNVEIEGEYSYSIEMIVDLALKGYDIGSTPVTPNPPERPSRLIKSDVGYLGKLTMSMARTLIRHYF